MSRNKVIVLIICLIVIYWALPPTGTAGLVKHNMLAIAPYIFVALIIYLFVAINILRKAVYRLHDNISTENALDVAKKMRFTFDTKRMLGADNLTNLYKRVNFSKNVSMEAKKTLYEAMKRKKLDVPPPSEGKNNPELEKQSSEEIKMARMGSNKKNKQKKNKK